MSENIQYFNISNNKGDARDEYAVAFPKITDLTRQQIEALSGSTPFYVTGPAGCGKSVVVLWKYINNIKERKNSIVFTYNVMLREFMRHCVKRIEGIPNNFSHNINTLYAELTEFKSTSKYCDGNNICEHKKNNKIFCWCDRKFFNRHLNTYEVIIDEAQDCDKEALEFLAAHVPFICISADFEQKMYQGRISNEQDLFRILGKYNKPIIRHDLKEVFRYPLGIYNFVVNITGKGRDRETLEYLEQKAEEENLNSILPFICQKVPQDKEIEYLKSLINTYSNTNIVILVPYSLRDTKDGRDKSNICSVEYYFEKLSKENGIPCSFYINKEDSKKTGLGYNTFLKKVHICSFKSAKGLEFDTVIIPKFEFINDAKENELREYYVAMTRAKTNLILLTELEIKEIQRLSVLDDELYNLQTYTDEKSYDDVDF